MTLSMDWLDSLVDKQDVLLFYKGDTGVELTPRELRDLLAGGKHRGWNHPDAWIVGSAQKHLEALDRAIVTARQTRDEFARRIGKLSGDDSGG